MQRDELPTRRTILAAAAAAVAAPALAPPASAQTASGAASGTGAGAPATQARGTVFEDDGTGRRGPSLRGIPGVLVSNGRDVVATGGDGAWQLPVADGDSVFVVKPTGWMTPVDPVTRLPRFARIHQPGGTPDSLSLRYRGVAPTGPLPESIDFPLRRQEEPGRFDVLLFTDPQPESELELSFVRDDVVGRAEVAGAAFGITTGDVMFDDLSLYDRHNRIVGTLGLPWYNLPGNHDMNLEAPDNRYSRETFRQVFGARHYAWQYGGVTFLALDNVEYLGGGKYRGSFGAAQLGFVRDLLARLPREAPVVACMHIPLRTAVGEEDSVATVDWQDFLDALGDRPNAISFSGHTHTNEHHYLGAHGHHHQVLSAVSGSWWSGPYDVRGIPVALASDGAPNGHHRLRVDGAQLRTELIPAHEPSRMRIMLETQHHAGGPEVQREYRMGQLLGGGPVPRSAAYGATLLANFYEGGPRSRLAFAVEGMEGFVPMRPAARHDPFVEEVYSRNAATKKPWVRPVRSTHLWQARLPADLAAGTRRVVVRATDEFGRTHEAAMVLEIVEA